MVSAPNVVDSKLAVKETSDFTGGTALNGRKTMHIIRTNYSLLIMF